MYHSKPSLSQIKLRSRARSLSQDSQRLSMPGRKITAAQLKSPAPSRISSCGRNPSSSDVDPIGQTTALLELYLGHFGIASASATNAVFFLRVPVLPVFVLCCALLLVCCSLLEELWSGQLSSGGICGTMCDGGVTISDVAKVVDL